MTMPDSLQIHTVELAPELWPQVERLFGKNGACGGCWRQAWRIEKGEQWKAIEGVAAKERLRKGILDGTCKGGPYHSFAEDVLKCSYKRASIAFNPDNLREKK
jgi:hypothetical protein